RLAEVAVRHRRALEVPARSAPPVRGGPGRRRRLTRLGRLPEREVERVALVRGRGRLVVARAEVLELLVGQLAVACPRADVEVHVARLAGVGVTAVDQPLHELD